jgi:hypothetical protein
MAPRRQAWTLSETQKLIENYDSPIQELVKLFPKHSKPSIERKMTRLRQEDKIGNKSRETVKKAYQLRHGNKEN